MIKSIFRPLSEEDGTFGFGFFEYDTDLSLFIENAEKEIHRVKKQCRTFFSKDTARADVIRYSALPWFAFSEMKHAGSIQTGDSIPKISTGKLIQEKRNFCSLYPSVSTMAWWMDEILPNLYRT